MPRGRSKRSSPVQRSVQKSGSSSHLSPGSAVQSGSSMRKSISMDQVHDIREAIEKLGDIEDEVDGAEKEKRDEESEKPVTGDSDPGVVKARSDSYSSLPRTFSRRKNISRSVVPKMRKLFEKSRSVEPSDLLTFKIKIQAEPNNGSPGVSSASNSLRDGTESARSSFLLLGPDSCLESDDYSREGSVELEETERKLDQDLAPKRGFVNKCVTKMKSLVGTKNHERL